MLLVIYLVILLTSFFSITHTAFAGIHEFIEQNCKFKIVATRKLSTADFPIKKYSPKKVTICQTLDFRSIPHCVTEISLHVCFLLCAQW